VFLRRDESIITNNNILSFLVDQEVAKRNWLLGVIGVSHSCHIPTLQSYVDHYDLAFLYLGPSCSLKSELTGAYHLFMRPALSGGLVDVIAYKEWDKIYYLYDSDEGEFHHVNLLHLIFHKHFISIVHDKMIQAYVRTERGGPYTVAIACCKRRLNWEGGGGFG
jgi:hypothetical protein